MDVITIQKLKEQTKSIIKEYHTPKQIGEKWQIDVKYVSKEYKK